MRAGSVYCGQMDQQRAWPQYIDATRGTDPNTVIASKVGVDPVTVGRWRAGTHDPKPRQVVEYARAYGLSPLSALVAAGYLTEDEIGIEVSVPTMTLSDFSVNQLAEELAQRLRKPHKPDALKGDFPLTTDVGDGRQHIAVLAKIGNQN